MDTWTMLNLTTDDATLCWLMDISRVLLLSSIAASQLFIDCYGSIYIVAHSYRNWLLMMDANATLRNDESCLTPYYALLNDVASWKCSRAMTNRASLKGQLNKISVLIFYLLFLFPTKINCSIVLVMTYSSDLVDSLWDDCDLYVCARVCSVS